MQGECVSTETSRDLSPGTGDLGGTGGMKSRVSSSKYRGPWKINGWGGSPNGALFWK